MAQASARSRAAASRAGWRAPAPARVARIRARMAEVYGVPMAPPHGDPLAELVLTVLSQSTNDRNRDVAFLRLRERFPSWEAVRDAPNEEIEEAIRPGGISKVKSARIQAILDAIGDPLDLSWMRAAPVRDSRQYLCALPGVGRKTAACVLLFAYGLRDVPVDTHVSRVGTRLGLLRPKAPFEELHDAMVALTPPGAELEFHVNLLRHGRRTCHSQRPACDACALARMCPSRRDLQPAAAVSRRARTRRAP
ncbi:MAG: endonuclease [Solirubrobacteraceae bacterium]|jgi:endonuclease-3|nr:endonuclease [Solirubrobacteraceae bacterium]